MNYFTYSIYSYRSITGVEQCEVTELNVLDTPSELDVSCLSHAKTRFSGNRFSGFTVIPQKHKLKWVKAVKNVHSCWNIHRNLCLMNHE